MARRKRTQASIKLRAIRKKQGFTFAEVHARSQAIAKELGGREFVIPPSRLHDFEVQGVVPSIFRIYTLARVYRSSVATILSWYGVPKR
jgi:hypothetical protein